MRDPIVSTSCGRLQGSIEKSIEGYKYYAFKGVPYAKPPVGELRFQDPQPPESWDGIRASTAFGSACAQYDQLARSYFGSDDCLFLNIYVKSINPKNRLPVMMWIHGGAFTFGSGDDSFYGPDYLLRKDIVFVTINYRLGVFGFLNLEDEIAPGNQGLKDQIMALKWIQTNIMQFGGDPNNVTIFGESSGGACVNHLGLSPMGKGLFHRAISQSGVALNPWATTPNPKKYAYNLCKYFGKETRDSKEIVEFLRTIDALELAKAQEKIRTLEERLQLLYPFGPAVDDKSKNPFMPIPVHEAAKNGMQVPYLLGHNDREGIYSLSTLQSHSLQDLNDNFENYIHPHLKDLCREHEMTPNQLRVLYDCKELKEENYAEKIADFLGDVYAVQGFHKMVKLQVLKNSAPIHLYQFTYDKGVSLTKLLTNTSIKGASHFDELPYLFNINFYKILGIEPLKKGTEGYRKMEEMVEMWTNFAKTGKPTPVTTSLLRKKWPPVTSTAIFRYMDIGSELNVKSTLNLEQHLSRGKFMKSKL